MKLLQAWVSTIALLMTLLLPRSSLAGAPACSPDFESWLATCSAQTGVAFSADRCVDGRALVQAHAEGDAVSIELRRSDGQPGFVQVSGFSLSPLGEYPDWRQAPRGARRGLDALSVCAAEHTLDANAMRPFIPPAKPAIWRMALALATLVAWLLFLLFCAPRRARHLDALLSVSAAVIIFAFRHFAIAPAFFHQNGHGADWVAMALCQPSTYGPGYYTFFHHAALLGGLHAEQAVFFAQECFAALAVIAVYAVGRGVGLPRLAALAATLMVGIEPLLSRLARSESYYAIILWLLMMAAAALVAPGLRARRREPQLLIGAAIAGALLSLAMTVHPVAWVPAAFLPAVLLMRTGSRRHVLRSLLLSAAVLGAVVCVVALPEVIAILQGTLGKQWSGTVAPLAKAKIVLVLGAPWVLFWLVPARLRAWVIPVLLLYAARRLEMETNMLHDVKIAPGEAWKMQFGVLFFAAALTLVARSAKALLSQRKHGVAFLSAAILAAGLVCAMTRWQRWTTLPTDAAELRVFGPLLQALPEGASVWDLRDAEQHRQELPLYRACTGLGPRARHVEVGSLPIIPVGHYWFHSSICATPSGRATCDAIEQQLVLRPLHVETFHALPSLPYLPYDADEIVSGLYHVEAIRHSR